MEWLQRNNPLYKNVKIDLEGLQAYPENDVLPLRMETIRSTEGQEGLTARYDDAAKGERSEVETASVKFESVAVLDVDGKALSAKMRAAALRHLK